MILYGITCGGPRLVVRIVAALDAGLDIVVVREPTLPPLGLLLPYGDRVVLHARMPGAVEAALRHGFGLHLPDGGTLPPGVRPRRLGRSTHSVTDARRALAEGADYAVLSPIWPPGSKPDDTRPTLGPAVFAEVAAVALGGVTPERAREAIAAGAAGVAAMGAIFGGDDPAAAVRAFRAAQKLQTSSS